MKRLSNIYDIRRYGKIAFLLTAAIVVALFLYVSNNLVKDLAVQERQRMEIWADATKEIINQFSAAEQMTTQNEDGIPTPPMIDIDFLLRIIESNTTIPVLLTDDDGNILNHRNFDLPEPVDTLNPLVLSPRNAEYLHGRLEALSHGPNVIDIAIAPGENQHLYYEDSTLLKRLSYYPYIQVVVMIIFLLIVYYAVLSTKKAEQNKVWVGLSKETAHQLGTPISSLMAWMELLPEMGVGAETVNEMNKDVKRLETIASRFGKIGSEPNMEPADAADIVRSAVSYMATRVSGRISLTAEYASTPMPISACAPLLEWVMENLIKNAVDAMDGHGAISVACRPGDHGDVVVDVADTGRGIPRKNFKTVFNPGYTTKRRGWGLGLALAKRIIEQYHHGRIYVSASTPGVGTTFTIRLPRTDDKEQ